MAFQTVPPPPKHPPFAAPNLCSPFQFGIPERFQGVSWHGEEAPSLRSGLGVVGRHVAAVIPLRTDAADVSFAGGGEREALWPCSCGIRYNSADDGIQVQTGGMGEERRGRGLGRHVRRGAYPVFVAS